MGLVDIPEDGIVNSLSNIPLGDKSKYRRMDFEGTENYDSSHHHHHQPQPIENTKKFVITCAIFASLNTVLVGYDVGVMSRAILFIQKDLNLTEVQEEVLVGCLSIVSLFGSLLGGKASDAIGRKWTMGLAAITFQTGGTTMALAPSFNVLMIGRVLCGVGIGFGIMIAPVYIAEISPRVDRGFS